MGILTNPDKEKIKRAVPKATNKIIDATVARLYIAYPDATQWTYTGLVGAIALVDDLVGHTFFLKLVDIIGARGVVWDQEVYVDFGYHQDRKFFHTFEMEECLAGLLFEDTNDAAHFYKRVAARHKHASRQTAGNKNAVALKGRLGEREEKHGTRGEYVDAATGQRSRRARGVLYYDDQPPAEWRLLYAELAAAGIGEDMIAENREFIKDYIAKQGGPLVGLEPPIPRRFAVKQPEPVAPPPVPLKKNKKAPPPPPPAMASASTSVESFHPPVSSEASPLPLPSPGPALSSSSTPVPVDPRQRFKVPPSNAVPPPVNTHVPPPVSTHVPPYGQVQPQHGQPGQPQYGQPGQPQYGQQPPYQPTAVHQAPPPPPRAGQVALRPVPAPPPRAGVPVPARTGAPPPPPPPRAARNAPPPPPSRTSRPVPAQPTAPQAALPPQPTQAQPPQLPPQHILPQQPPQLPPAPQQNYQPPQPPQREAMPLPPLLPAQNTAPPPPPPMPALNTSAPPPPPLPTQNTSAPPPPPIGDFNATPAAPPPPPDLGQAAPAGLPAVDSGRDALLSSIRSAGVGALKKTDKSQLEKPSVLLQEARGESPAAPPSTGGGMPGAPESLADALANALNKRKNKVAASDDEDDNDDW